MTAGVAKPFVREAADFEVVSTVLRRSSGLSASCAAKTASAGQPPRFYAYWALPADRPATPCHSAMYRLAFTECLLAVTLAISAGPAHGGELADEAPTFGRFVMPVLTKVGCNSGACHGYRSGRGGLKLSLRGENANQDFDTLVRQFAGRRVDRVQPDNSLMLLKPTAQVPHEGGRRFAVDALEYQLLRRWIEAGTPEPNENAPRLVKLEVAPPARVVFEPDIDVQLAVTASFDDGKQFDVTDLAVYETSNTLATVSRTGLVERRMSGETTVMVRFLGAQQAVPLAFMPARPEFAWSNPPPANYVDRHVFEKLRTLRINPSGLCSDSVFVRRAFLDVIGLMPTADEARQFVVDSNADKRARLIDQLLARPEFGEHWALKWSDVLRNEEKTLDPHGVEVFHAWLRDSFNDGKPLDQFARELIAARGSTYKNPPANMWRAQRDPLTRAETTARVFLGVRLQCAKCHNHPTGRWTQDDYYSWASLFARIDYKIVDNNRKDKFDKHEFDGEQIVLVKDSGEVKNARTGADATPKFLGAETPQLDVTADRLEPTARWLTDPDNAWFARAQVNRIWFHVMGRALIDPVDDLRITNPPSHPALMDTLVADFVASGYDVRNLIRTIMNSRTYQLDYATNETNAADDVNYSHAVVRRLTAEQLLDAQCQFLDTAPQFNGYPRGTRAGQLAGVRRVRPRDKPPTPDEQFLMAFGKPERLLACECERSNTTTLPHALYIICGPTITHRIEQEGNRIDQLLAAGLSDAQVFDELFWSGVTRAPTTEEIEQMHKLMERQDRRQALQDIAWALMNSKEFVFRH